MVNLPNGCKCIDFTVFPKNWHSKRASLKEGWYIKYRFYHPEYSQPKQIMVNSCIILRQLNCTEGVKMLFSYFNIKFSWINQCYF